MEIVEEKAKSEICSHIKKYDSIVSSFHWHKRYEICQVINKPCRFLLDGIIIEANEGDIITIDEQIVHRFIIDNSDTYVRIIQFPLKLIFNISATIKPLKPHITLNEIKSVPNLDETLKNLFEIMDQEGLVNHSGDNPFFQSICASLYFLLMRNFSIKENLSFSQKDRQDFFEITDYIHKHFTENIDVNTIATSLYSSRRRLASLFSKYSGIGLNVYINTLRIKNANRLLISGSTITEAAFESGFQTIRTFNNAYKSYMGITPSEFIKNNTNKNN